ncbi:hypothetical protein C1I97_37165 [Streptomyces sp. NTH33]|uniref:hypothetical protein n=1 Tax=Streptomyces sp. NTH33 TaxID=1735453 RepID=UPI000DA802A4|nr:hypothetical protein [Streptomyces sp. NTH33]PZG77140.1 hypothetical protein C1I97_37165 [Streptomyces sp. NTH33]
MSHCTICPRDAPDGQHVCPLHADEVRAWLTELPRQARLLAAFVAPAGRPAQGRLGGTGRAHAPLPVDLRVLTLLGPGRADALGGDDDGTVPILAWLGAWAGHIAYTYPSVARDAHGTAHVQPCDQAWPRQGQEWPRRRETITGWCIWLTRYLPYALTLSDVGDLHQQLGDLIHRVRDLTHAVPHRQEMAAPCPECDAAGLVRTDGQWGISCTVCGHHLEPQAYDDHAAAVLKAYQAKNEPAA